MSSSRVSFVPFLAALTALCAQAWAQTPSPANPLSDGARQAWKSASSNVLRSAEKMPEENYSFKPTPAVFTFGQMIGHIADAQFGACSGITGAARPEKSIKDTKTSKVDLVAALKDSIAVCNTAAEGLTDANAAGTAKPWGVSMPRLTALSMNTTHTMEHYGNLVTYLRIKGLVPPSSERPR